jgi:hypothetical protein
MNTLTFKSKNNFKSATLNERAPMFGNNYPIHYSVRFFDGTGTLSRNYKTIELAKEAIEKFMSFVVVFEDTIEFYKSYNIHQWFLNNMPLVKMAEQELA